MGEERKKLKPGRLNQRMSETLDEAQEWTFKGQIKMLAWREVTWRNGCSGLEEGMIKRKWGMVQLIKTSRGKRKVFLIGIVTLHTYRILMAKFVYCFSLFISSTLCLNAIYSLYLSTYENAHKCRFFSSSFSSQSSIS